MMGWHVAKIGDRWAALEPIRQGLTIAFGTIAPKVALGVALRHDWGSQYTANTFVNEIKCWGFTDTPAFVGVRVRHRHLESFRNRRVGRWCLEENLRRGDAGVVEPRAGV